MANPNVEAIDITATAVLNVNMCNVTKLNSHNYLTWNLQLHALLDDYGLAGYLDGSTSSPPPTITANNTTSPNPALLVWQREDKLIYNSWLGFVSVSIQPMLSCCRSTADIWDTLASTFAKPSRGHIKTLKHQLKHLQKGTRSVDEYLRDFTTKIDQLTLLDHPVDHEDQVEYLLEGLPEEFKQVVDQIESRDSPPSLTEVHEKLCNFEAKLLSASTYTVSAPTTANVAFRAHYKSRYNHISAPQWPNNSTQPQAQQDNKQRRGYQGRCQICGVQGHSARQCPQFTQSASNTQINAAAPPPWQPRANVAVNQTHSDSSWLLDSGSSHHLTSDLQNLSLHQPYHGDDTVVVGNGAGLPISHTGERSELRDPIALRQNT